MVVGVCAMVALVVSLGAGAGTTAAAAAPQNTSPPTITGTAQEGQKLVGSRGTWSGSPTDYNDYWQRCNSNGDSCANISGANAAAGYASRCGCRQLDPVPGRGEERGRRHVRVVCAHGGDQNRRDAAAEHVAADGHGHGEGRPEARRPPRQLERQGDRLQRLLGALRQGRWGCADIGGATDRNGYVLKGVDVGNTIRFKVEAKEREAARSPHRSRRLSSTRQQYRPRPLRTAAARPAEPCRSRASPRPRV